jgi:hypothetical protein
MQITMDQGFGDAQKLKLQSLHRDLEIGVTAEIRRGFIELRRRPSIQFRNPVWIGENEIFGDFAKLRIGAKGLHARFFHRGREIKVRRFEKGLSREFCEIVGELRVDNAANESFSENDVRRQILHHDGGHRFVEVIDFGNQISGVGRRFR